MNFGSLLNLQWIDLGSNQLGYNQPYGGLSFLSSFVNITCLKFVGLFKNSLSGELPNSIVNLSSTLVQLDFSENNIYGSIPQEIGNLDSMTTFELYKNMLTGSIPDTICKLSKLGILYLSDNNISGVIPACISNISGLISLCLENNLLHGSIPTPFFNISTLQGFSIYNNHLSGVISEHVVGLSSLCLFLYLDENLLTGPMPSNIGGLRHLVALGLSDNKLTGPIPTSLGDCVMLEELFMEQNHFTGRIPPSLKNLKSLELLDLSNNNLSGNIPHIFEEFPLLNFINLSHNKLEGEMPKKGPFSNISAFSVVGNSQLCGGIEALQLPNCPANSKKNKKRLFPSIIIPLAVLLSLGICLTFVCFRFKKSKQKNVQILDFQDNQYPRLSYQDLLLATIDFSSSNLLGEGRYGSVYKGTLEASQEIVAVKVLNVEVHGANKKFIAECETLRNIRHRNLIKIITTCSSIDFKGNDFKAIIFEFMAQGSLDNWLHPCPCPSDEGNERNLTLFQRINVAIDVALAVDYLHHQCHIKIIHCDIKPSNEKCMGNAQLGDGNRNELSCVFPRGQYKGKNYNPNVTHNPVNPLLSNFFLPSTISDFQMALLNWVPPPVGTLKVNVHAAAFHQPMPNGNTSGIGVVLRTSDGNLVNCIAGTIPGLSPLGAQLWSVQIGLRRAFVEGAESVIVETDNMQAFGAVQFAHLHQHPEYDDLIHQIVTRIRDPNWDCSFRFVYSVRNTTATYVSLLGGELFCRLYLFYEPIGRMSELMHLDMGLGPQAPQFIEAPMVDEEWEAFDDILADGAGVLAQAFMANLVLQAPGVQHEEPQMHDVVFEDEILLESDEDDEDLFDLF